jgi:hypothetical protein
MIAKSVVIIMGFGQHAAAIARNIASDVNAGASHIAATIANADTN